MTMRKQNYAEKIAELKAEIATTETFMESNLKKVAQIRQDYESGKPVDMKKVDELLEIYQRNNRRLKAMQKIVDSYYRPVVA